MRCDQSAAAPRWGLVALIFLAAAQALTGCQASAPIRTAEQVDLPRFMGDWYVLGNIPTPIERQAFNAVETYELTDTGKIDTQFRFRRGAFDGVEKTYHPTGFVRDTGTNSVWGMQFIWPFKAEYRVIYVNDSYTQTIIGRSKRDYLWIMARHWKLSQDDYAALVAIAVEEGYDADLIRRVPQRWE